MNPKFFIIIPTRNRYDTLKYTIQTCLNQNYDNLEIIISDNASSDNTQYILKEFTDHRIKYQRSDILLPMIYSWEFALSYVKEQGYIHFLGDDNGLTSDALNRIALLIHQTSTKIVLSKPIQFTWPNNIAKNGYLSIPIGEKIYMINSKSAIKSAYNLSIGFDRLPTINASFVHTSVINKVKSIFNGKYFIASNPDVCSAIANASIEKYYIYSEIPFVINGASKHSNGMQGSNNVNNSTFIDDNLKGGYNYHPLFPASRSYYLNVYEAFAIISDLFKSKNINFPILNYKKLFKRFKVKEYYSLNKYWLFGDLKEFAKRIDINDKIIELESHNKSYDPTENEEKIFKIDGSEISFYSRYIQLNNIYDSSVFSTQILNNKNLLPSNSFRKSFIYRIKNFIIYNCLIKSKTLK